MTGQKMDQSHCLFFVPSLTFATIVNIFPFASALHHGDRIAPIAFGELTIGVDQRSKRMSHASTTVEKVAWGERIFIVKVIELRGTRLISSRYVDGLFIVPC